VIGREFSWSAVLPPVLTVVVALVAWEVIVRAMDVQTWLLPPPSMIFGELVDSFTLLSKHAGTTLTEMVVGFAVSVALGVTLAAGIASFRTFERSLYPLIIASQTIPIFTLAPLLIIWVGTDIMSKIIVIVLFTFFPIVISVVTGLRQVENEMVDMFRTLGANQRQILIKLMIPTALPNVFAGMKVAAVISVIGAVIGEWVGASSGLGYLMKLSGPQFLTARVFAAIVFLSVMAMGFFAVVALTERYVLRNHPSSQRSKGMLGEL